MSGIASSAVAPIHASSDGPIPAILRAEIVTLDRADPLAVRYTGRWRPRPASPLGFCR